MGDLVVRRRDEAPDGLAICGLGSCVALFIHDRDLRVGGMAHVLLPEPDAASPLTAPGRFAPTAVAALIDQLQQRGARRSGLVAKIAGGAHMFGTSPVAGGSLGDRNIRSTLLSLERERIEVAAMDVGGSWGRSIVAQIATGIVRVTGLSREPLEL
jgi:chemotaxis protein CheD